MAECPDVMSTHRAVKQRLFFLAGLCLSGLAVAEPTPDAREILKTVRMAQAAQHQTLNGRLRNGSKVLPFRMVIDGTTIRYEFTTPPQTIQLRLLDRSSRLEEITRGGTEKVSAARFDAPVRDTDISYEDLAMKFLYWPDPTVEGSQILLLRKCWIIRAEPPSKNDSQYGHVMLWIDKDSGALMQAEAFDRAGKFARRFKVISGQKIDGAWILKTLRIEAATPGTSKDRTPTYLEISGVEHE